MQTVEIETAATAESSRVAGPDGMARFLEGPTSTGRSAKKRQEAMKELIARLRYETRQDSDGRIEGPLRPCTVVNFNPVEAVVQGQIRLTIPRPGTTKHHQVVMTWKNHRMQGHYCVIGSPMMGVTPDKEPVFYSTVVNWERDERLPVDVPVSEPRVYTPWSIGCEIVAQYNSPSTKLMGGLLFFDQDIHAISSGRLERNGGKIYVPEREVLPNSAQYVYRLREAFLEEELDRIFEQQQQYADIMIQLAHSLWVEENPESRKMITDTHREWARYAESKGWLPGGLPEWVSARLITGSSPTIAQLSACPYCGEQQKHVNVHFCKQGHPFDVIKALKAGLAVPEQYIDVLADDAYEQAQQILEERRQRSAGRRKTAATKPEATTEGETTAEAAKPAAAKGAAAKAEKKD